MIVELLLIKNVYSLEIGCLLRVLSLIDAYSSRRNPIKAIFTARNRVQTVENHKLLFALV